MKHLLLLNVMLFASVFSLANKNLQIKAEKSYAEKNYKDAIIDYETLIKEDLISYKLYYNLGNAYYKNNELGKAIYNYELANKLQPNNKDIQTNLRIANEKTIDKIESRENFIIVAIKSGLVNSFSTKGWAWFSIFSFWGFLLFTFIFFTTNHLLLKRLGFFSSVISFIVFASSMTFGYTALNDKNVINFAIILKQDSKIHVEPNLSSKLKFNLHEGTKVSVLEANTTWTNIKLENGNEGWLKTSDVGLF